MTEFNQETLPWGLIVVDMQRYYLDPDSAFSRFHHQSEPNCLKYISSRCENWVTPNIKRLCQATRELGRPVLYLRLCGQRADRSDLHYLFRRAHEQALGVGFENLYPVESDPFSDVIPEIAPQGRDIVMTKTTFSGFTTSALPSVIKEYGLKRLLFTGLATSQCVETTARDAADRGLRITHVEDAQADYSETMHRASLYSSQGVCGGHIVDTDSALQANWFQ